MAATAIVLIQATVQRVSDAPQFWPLAIIGTFLTVVLSAWTLLARISARFDKALDQKLAPLAKQLQDQGERFQQEAVRLEGHFDAAIHDHETQWRKEITNIANSLRGELKQLSDQMQDGRVIMRENRTMVDNHSQQLQESRMDRQQLRRDLDNVTRSLESFERNQEANKDKIMGAIEASSGKITNGQNEFSTRLTRVEEALKFYAKVRTD
jgi:hypothetical protein